MAKMTLHRGPFNDVANIHHDDAIYAVSDDGQDCILLSAVHDADSTQAAVSLAKPFAIGITDDIDWTACVDDRAGSLMVNLTDDEESDQ